MPEVYIVETDPRIGAKIKRNDGYCISQRDIYWDKDGAHKGGKIPPLRCMCRPFRKSKEGSCFCGRYIKIPTWGLWYPLDVPEVVEVLNLDENLVIFKDGKYYEENSLGIRLRINSGELFRDKAKIEVGLYSTPIEVKGSYWTPLMSYESRFLEYSLDPVTVDDPDLLKSIEPYGKTLEEIGGKYVKIEKVGK